MPLSDNEQRILEEIERRLAEEDPRLADTVQHTSLYTHLARRIRWAAFAFFAGFVLLMFFSVSLWIAATGFGVMLVSSLMVYRYLKQMGRDQVRAWQEQGGPFSLAGFLGRLAGRIRGRRTPPAQ